MAEPLPPGVHSNPVAAETLPPSVIMPPTGAAEILGSPPVLLFDAAQNLLERARQLSGSAALTELQLAVIFAQSACELASASVLNELLQRLTADVRRAVLSLCGETISLADSNTRKLWRSLTNDQVADQTWWKEWKDNRVLRNDIAHEGRQVRSAEAARSVELAGLYIGYVRSVAAAKMPRA